MAVMTSLENQEQNLLLTTKLPEQKVERSDYKLWPSLNSSLDKLPG